METTLGRFLRFFFRFFLPSFLGSSASTFLLHPEHHFGLSLTAGNSACRSCGISGAFLGLPLSFRSARRTRRRSGRSQEGLPRLPLDQRGCMPPQMGLPEFHPLSPPSERASDKFFSSISPFWGLVGNPGKRAPFVIRKTSARQKGFELKGGVQYTHLSPEH